MAVTFNKIVGKTRQIFLIVDKNSLHGKCLAIAIVINEMCKKHNIKCNIIRKYILEDNNKYYNHFMVSDGSVCADTTLISPEMICDEILGTNNLSEEERLEEDNLYKQYQSYINGELELVEYFKKNYMDKIIL
ncbi:unknown similar to AMEV023 [Choristoneura biennis entomopoxvirus]|uniref:Uncharacterized protein n=1 Tax=Choristoneura biennis entomopoxvirus TaxID=10288 RepID=A0A916P1J7_CBEPV|nr:unknown similar to AMEV023 [Choristoneura biennis entomopoxvirus]CCU55874.1 unknown similar to AMEV023 [Choristoneura biennis entomopoxvirus]